MTIFDRVARVGGTAILLVTPNDLSSNEVGAIFLRPILAAFPAVRTMSFRGYFPQTGVLKKLPERISSPARALLWRFGLINLVRVRLYALFMAQRDARGISQQADNMGIRTIWMQPSSPEAIFSIRAVQRLNKDVRILIWDMPDLILQSQKIGGSTRRRVLEAFDAMLNDAKGIAVIGEGMAQAVAPKSRAVPVILRQAITHRPAPALQPNPKKLRIIFTGSLYSKHEWNALIAALDLLDWKIGDRKIHVYFVGSFPRSGTSRGRRVKRLPPRPYADTLDLIARCDLGYVPYWLTADRADVVQTSFPGKLSAYLAARRPVFFHGPEAADAARFIVRHRVGSVCSSAEPEIVAQQLCAWFGGDGSDKLAEAIERCIDLEFSQATINSRFAKFISCAP